MYRKKKFLIEPEGRQRTRQKPHIEIVRFKKHLDNIFPQGGKEE